MYYYRVADLTLRSVFLLKSFSAFACEEAEPDVILEETDELPPAGKDQHSGEVTHRQIPDGWFFHPRRNDRLGLYVNRDYTRLRMLGMKGSEIVGIAAWYVRIALECRLIRMGYLSLHSAAVELDGESIAFTGPSGMGKSTRADTMIRHMGAKLINGDRPLISVRDLVLYGVPWDGKEQCFRNVRFPLKAVCEVRRSASVYIRALGYNQRRRLLMQQSFIPMWDTETAMLQMANISRFARSAEIVRAFSGPEEADIRALYDALRKQKYLKEEPDMKANPGFVLRNVVGEYVLMPTGDNISKFQGTVLLNEVSALVWEKLQSPVSKEDLLKAVLDEFEVEKAVASADLDVLLETLRGYNLIVDD